jgi:hypothetical protein
MNPTQIPVHFDTELQAVSAQLLAMGGLAESQLSQALYAITRASGGSTPPRWTWSASSGPWWRGISPRRATCGC